MSVIFDLNDDLSNLATVIKQYESHIVKAENDLCLEGKTLQTANCEQPVHYSYYNTLHQQLKSIERMVANKVQHKKGCLWRQFKENYTIQLSPTDINNYIDSDLGYYKMQQLLLIVQEMTGNMSMLVKSFEQRGFALRNLTQIRVHELQQTII